MNESTEVERKSTEYNSYIYNHISNVKKAFEKYGDYLVKKLEIDKEKLAYNVSIHDQSKFDSEEFVGYRKKFYPTDKEKETQDKKFIEVCFDKAWLHHLRNNPHHPEYWVYVDDNFKIILHPMDPIYIAEMILDWIAMSIQNNSSTYDYWRDHRDQKPLHSSTIKLVDEILDDIKDMDEQ